MSMREVPIKLYVTKDDYQHCLTVSTLLSAVPEGGKKKLTSNDALKQAKVYQLKMMWLYVGKSIWRV